MTKYFGDTDIGSDSGSGTIDDPWGVASGNLFQKALDNITSSGVGDSFHVKGSASVDYGGVDLNFLTLGTPVAADPFGFSAYTSAAWDGGRVDVDLGGAVSLLPIGQDFIFLGDLNVAGGTGFQLNSDNDITCFRLDIDAAAGTNGINTDLRSRIIGCDIRNSSGTAIETLGGLIVANTVEVANNARGIRGSSSLNVSTMVMGNIVTTAGTGSSTRCIEMPGDSVHVWGNSVYSSVASTGVGIRNTSGGFGNLIMNNYVEGFDGSGGVGIDIQAGSSVPMYMNNRWFECESGESINGAMTMQMDNSVLSASGFRNAGSDDFRPTSELIGAGFPTGFLNLTGNRSTWDIGAIMANIRGINRVGHGGPVG